MICKCVICEKETSNVYGGEMIPACSGCFESGALQQYLNGKIEPGSIALYNPTTAAALLHNAITGKPGLSRQRVRDLCAAGRLGQRIEGGRGWIITSEEIERFNELERKRGVKK